MELGLYRNIVGAGAAILFGGLVAMAGGRHPPVRMLKAYREFSGMVKEKSQKLTWYQKQEEKLKKYGAAWHYGKKVDPLRLLLVQLLLALCGVLVGGSLFVGKRYLGILLGGGLFFVPQVLLPVMNRRDNEQMLPEIRMIFQALSMQIKSGIYVTDALAECYTSVRQPRLRSALLDLASDLVMKADVFQALDRFQKKFDNRYIDSLCITILQAMESGQAVELLGDIAEQVHNMESAVLSKRKGRLDRSLTFYQLGMLTAVMMVAIYACASYMLSSVTFFK